MNISEKIQKIVEDMPKVYEAGHIAGYEEGQKSMIDESKIIEKTASGTGFLNIEEVSEVPHEVKVQLSSDTITDFSNVSLEVYNSNLFDKNNLQKGFLNDIEGNLNTSGTYKDIARTIYIDLPKGTYTISFGANVKIIRLISNGVYSTPSGSDINNVNYYVAHTEGGIMGFSFRHYDNTNWNDDNLVCINCGHNPQPYEDYKKEVFTSKNGNFNIKSISPTMNFICVDNDINISVNYYKSYGAQVEYNRFWDDFQECGTKIDYGWAFCGAGWNIDTFKPKYDIIPSGGYMIFRNFNRGSKRKPIDMVELCKNLDITFSTKNATTMTYIFQNANISRLGTIHLGQVAAYENTFIQCSNLVTIEEIDFGTKGTQLWYNVFKGCTKLANLNSVQGIIGQNADFSECPLTAQSIKNVVNVLSDTASGKTITLKKTAVNTAFNIDVDDESTWGEGTEYYELRHSKDNWTFSYV